MLSAKEITEELIVEMTPQGSCEPYIAVQAYMIWALGGFDNLIGSKPTSPTVSCTSAIKDCSSSVQVASLDALKTFSHLLKNKPAIA